MDEHNEQHQEEDNLLREPTDQRSEESSEEPAGRRSEEPTDQPKAEAAAAEEEERSSDEESMAGSSLFVHPCSLLQYLARAFASCLGIQDSFGGTTKRSAAVSPASVDSSREGEADRSTGATGFYMQEVITRVWAVRRPRPPGNAREGNGGNGGHHH
ncbi:hypothetical protein ACQ4PT_039135 [Festuca glaucescens]